jgi:hypothetical protein
MEQFFIFFEDGSARLFGQMSVCLLPWKGCSVGYVELIGIFWLACAFWLLLAVDADYLSWRQAWGWLGLVTTSVGGVALIGAEVLAPYNLGIQTAGLGGLALLGGLSLYLIFEKD